MSEWVGFTDADLQRMKNSGDGGQSARGAKIVKPLTGGRPKPASNIGQRPQKKQNPKNTTSKSPQSGVPQAAMLSKPPPKKVDMNRKVITSPTTPNEQMPLHGKISPTLPEKNEKGLEEKTEKDLVKEPEILEDTEVIKEKEKLQLADIQKRQKEMEEKNKRKKTILTKAIAERKKKAFAESHKLVEIQEELGKLDGMLNYDVSIVRDKIDAACWEYNHAQRRFEKAEAEYIDAKINLHKTTEIKEELTEHLYELIQLNEERKANKLEELMQKLELEETTDPEPTNEEAALPVATETSKPASEPKSIETQESATDNPPMDQDAFNKESDTKTVEENKIEPVPTESTES